MTVDPKTDFSDIVDLLGPSELRKFCLNLDGLSYQDIEKAEFSANTTDVDLKAKSVLHKWLQKNGQQATRPAVLKALEKSGFKYALEKLREKWGLTGTNGHNCQINGDFSGSKGESLLQGADALPDDLPFQMLINDLRECIKDEDVVKIRKLIKGDKDRISAVNDFDSLLEYLNEVRLFDANNLVYLPLLLTLHFGEKPPGEKHLSLELLQQFQEGSLTSPLYLSEIKRDPCYKYRFVELIISGDTDHFNVQDMEYYKKKLANMLRIPCSEVKFESANKGSIILVYMIPSTSVADLMAADNLSKLRDLKVVGVHVQGEEYISLNDMNKDAGGRQCQATGCSREVFVACHLCGEYLCQFHYDQDSPCADHSGRVSPLPSLTSLHPEDKSFTSGAKGSVAEADPFDAATYKHLFAAPRKPLSSNEALESDFCQITNELGPDELQHLYHNLGIKQHHIEHAERSADTTDARLKARAVLRWWRKVNGRDATRAVLFEARRKLPDRKKGSVAETNAFAFDVAECQRELRNFYLQRFCKIPLFPGNNRHFLNMDDIYVNLSMLIDLPKPCRRILVPINSHHEIFTREMDNGIPPFRILVLGHPGCGKTSLTLKLAHDWAVGKSEPPLKNISFLFALNMRWMTPKTTLEDAIFQQLLPKDTKLTRSSLRKFVETNQSACIILFDSYDENGSCGNLKKEDSGVQGILLNEYLRQCQVLVTSRFLKAGDFDDLHDIYTQIQITGFSNENIKDYVFRFFQDDRHSGEKLLEYLIDLNLNPGIANVPLMTLLFCMYWKECNGQDMPYKIGDLYSKVFKFLEKLYIAKSIFEPIDLPQLIINLGDVAFSGMWSAEHKPVFSLEEFVCKSSEQIVNDGCRIGLLSIEHGSTGFLEALEENSDIIRKSLSAGSKSSVTFFHKSCQEKCAGEFLAHVCETDPAIFTRKLQYLDSARTCMRLEMVLRFACGASSKAAYLILEQLLQVFMNTFSTLIQSYYEETLEPDVTKEVQKFIELCLHCYYERSHGDELHPLLNELFREGQMLFVGMSPPTSHAVEKYMSQAHSIKSLTVQGIPSGSTILPGVINRGYKLVHSALKSLPAQTLQQQQNFTGSRDFRELCQTTTVAYFGDWQSSYSISLIPIFTSLHSCDNLETLELVNVKLGDQMTSLQSTIERGGLNALRRLGLCNSSLTNEQSDHLLLSIPHKLPKLERLDISHSKARLTRMCDCLVKSQIQRLDVSYMEAPAQDMADIINKLPLYGPRMLSLNMHGNVMDDNTGKILANVLPCAHQLEVFSISLDMMKRNTHNKVINAMQHLTHLIRLYIAQTHYLDDLFQCISNTMCYLPQLQRINLSASQQGVSRQSSQSTSARFLPWLYDRGEQSTGTHVQHHIKRSACQQFITRLSSMEKMNTLVLLDICLHREDLMALLTLCQQRNYAMLRYSKHLFPDDIDSSQYDFLIFA